MIPLAYMQCDWDEELLAFSLLYKQAEERFEEVTKMTKKMTNFPSEKGDRCKILLQCVRSDNYL